MFLVFVRESYIVMLALLKSVLGIPFCCFPCFGGGEKRKIANNVNDKGLIEGLCDQVASTCPLSIFKGGQSTRYEQNTKCYPR